MIKICKLIKVFNEDTIIKYRDNIFEDNKSYMILGPSGCGKSTLLNMIAGVLSPNEGKINIDDVDITSFSQVEKDKYRLNNIGYIFQDFKMLEEMTVEDNINLLKLGDVDISNIDNILKEVDLINKKKSKIKHLSGGEKQRVAIARALIKNPKIILADEPTGNLNYEKGIQIMELLNKIHNQNNKTMIIVSHDERMSKYVDKTLIYTDLLLDGEMI